MTTPLGLDLTTLLVLALDLDLIISINNTVKYIISFSYNAKLKSVFKSFSFEFKV